MQMGKLFQHVSHPGQHEITDYDGNHHLMSSTHHQMMSPLGGNNHTIIAYAEGLSPYHQNGKVAERGDKDLNFIIDSKGNEVLVEPEIVYYPNLWVRSTYPKKDVSGSALLIQGHPEFFDNSHPTIKWLQGILDLWFKPENKNSLNTALKHRNDLDFEDGPKNVMFQEVDFDEAMEVEDDQEDDNN